MDVLNILKRIINYFGIKLNKDQKLLAKFRNKSGIEIGGPSPIFSSELPVYSVIKALDGCNFSDNTIWEGSITKGLNYNYFLNKKGYQYISEASDLSEISSNKYNFLLASHCLEHCANPIKTIKEWIRVIHTGGIILLILPHKDFTFDHKRKITSFKHLIDDFENDVTEKDLTHLEEILINHDLSLDIPAGDIENFRLRSMKNYENRCLHHHVFDFDLLEELFDYFKLRIIYKDFKLPYHQIIVGQKS